MQATTFYYFGLYMDFCTDMQCKYIHYWISSIKSINSDIIKNYFNVARKRISQKGLLLLAFCLLALLRATVLQRKQDPHPPVNSVKYYKITKIVIFSSRFSLVVKFSNLSYSWAIKSFSKTFWRNHLKIVFFKSCMHHES